LPAQRAERDAHVAADGGHPFGHPFLAHAFARARHAAEVTPRFGFRIGSSHAGGEVLRDPLLEMKRNLFVEVAFERLRPPQVAQATPGALHTDLSTRLTATARRFQCSSSSASRRRPAAVIV
jgi:hypothetical protein